MRFCTTSLETDENGGGCLSPEVPVRAGFCFHETKETLVLFSAHAVQTPRFFNAIADDEEIRVLQILHSIRK
jgi:hypothetical protein